MPTEPAAGPFLPYVAVEANDEWRPATGITLHRWVIVDGRGEAVSPPVPRQSAFKWCAALMWWLTQSEVCVRVLPRSPG
jgi:hypothetical protein